MLDVHDRLMRSLEQAGRLDRALEALPDARGDRRAPLRRASASPSPSSRCCSPTARSPLYAALLDSDLPEDPYLSRDAGRVLPGPAARALPGGDGAPPAAAGDHRDVRDQQHGGPRRVDVRLSHAGGHRRAGVGHRAGLRGGDARCSTCARSGPTSRRSTSRSTRTRRSRCCSTPAGSSSARRAGCCATGAARSTSPTTVERFADGARAIAEALPGILAGDDRAGWDARVEELGEARVPDAVARRVAGLGALFSALDIVEVSAATERSVEEVAALHFAARRAPAPALAARPDRGAAARRSLAGDGARGTARRPVQPPRRADGRRAAERAGGRGDHRGRAARRAGSPRTRVPRSARSACWTTSATSGSYDLTTLPVALREVRDLIRAGDAQPSRAPLPAPAGG